MHVGRPMYVVWVLVTNTHTYIGLHAYTPYYFIYISSYRHNNNGMAKKNKRKLVYPYFSTLGLSTYQTLQHVLCVDNF